MILKLLGVQINSALPLFFPACSFLLRNPNWTVMKYVGTELDSSWSWKGFADDLQSPLGKANRINSCVDTHKTWLKQRIIATDTPEYNKHCFLTWNMPVLAHCFTDLFCKSKMFALSGSVMENYTLPGCKPHPWCIIRNSWFHFLYWAELKGMQSRVLSMVLILLLTASNLHTSSAFDKSSGTFYMFSLYQPALYAYRSSKNFLNLSFLMIRLFLMMTNKQLSGAGNFPYTGCWVIHLKWRISI